ncbi:MAG TPA: hypothetical protein VJK03_03210 [Candidatus Nanoarchaeia archaeon]|nr:hypothetical protein [Candidatus Nanoarchaeia archaeon]
MTQEPWPLAVERLAYNAWEYAWEFNGRNEQRPRLLGNEERSVVKSRMLRANAILSAHTQETSNEAERARETYEFYRLKLQPYLKP